MKTRNSGLFRVRARAQDLVAYRVWNRVSVSVSDRAAYRVEKHLKDIREEGMAEGSQVITTKGVL